MKNFWDQFKDFISRGNVIDLAVGVIIGGAFSAIVTALVDNIIMPLIGVILGGLDFTSLSIKIGDANIQYGSFIQAIVNFLIISFCLFIFIKIIDTVQKKAKLKKEAEPKKEPEESKEVLLLTEIRDALVKDKK